ncbi:hypothetical protein [Arthrobacter caoxuetaonis]|nr:hypothetical protein [Arthrobacter caoxuetaonis]MCC3282694.1 hypothetical protein [Arthrobacter caoxuetaonis]
MIVGLSILGGFALGIATMPASELDEPAAQPRLGTAAAELAALSGSAMEPSGLTDDPTTAVYEPFIACSADYPNGPGAALDRSNLIGPENSVMASPEQLRAMGLPESEVTAQAHTWQELNPEVRAEQLCRATYENAAVDALR